MSVIAHSPHWRSRFASTVAKPCQHPKGLRSHRDVISDVEKGQGQPVQHNCNPPAITTVTPWGSSGDDGRWATELSATRGAPNSRYLEVIALDILLQAAYYLLNISHIALPFPSGHSVLLQEWLDAYCETHQVYFLGRITFKNNRPKQGRVPSVHLVRSDQFKHAETGKAFLVQSQAVYQHNLHWGHRGSQYTDLDNLQHPFVLASYHQAKLSNLVHKANRDIYRLQESRLPQVSDCHRVRLYNLNPRRKPKHKARYERKIGLGRPCALSKVHTVRSKGNVIEYESIYLKDQDRKRPLYHEMGIDMLGTALDFKAFKSLKAKTMFQSNTLLMLAKYMVQGRNYNKVEQEGELGSPQEGTCSQKDRTVQKCDAAKPHERSKTTAGKKRSTGSAEHPNDEDDLNDSGKDGDISGKRNKKRVKESGLKFACPFFKHDPERYKTTRSCMGPGWTNVHRVKEHIFRSHCEPPFKCFRCHSAFKTEDELSDHQRQTVPCKVCVPESQDRHGLSTINADTEKRLRSRKTNKSLTEEEKWFNMYQLIFPGHSPPLSPYHSETEDLVALFNRSIGPRFRLDLRERLKREFLDSFPSSTMLDDILHQAMAALTNAFLNESDIDGKDSETSIDSLQVESFFDESSERTAVAKRVDAVSFNPKLPHELKSLPQSVNDTVLNHSTAADSGYTGWLSTTSKPTSNSSSGTKAMSSPLGSGEDIDPEKASASIPHLDSEDQLKVGTHGLRQTILREPLLPPSPDASQSTVHERPSGYSYINICHHDAGDSSHEYRETCQVANQGNDSRHPFTSPSDIEIWNPFEQELAYPYEPLGSISFNVHLAD